MNFILLATYILLSTGGATLIKLGGSSKWDPLFTVPYFNMPVSLITLSGIVGYGLSFLVFIVLLSKLDLSTLTPIATGVSYALLMGASVFIFSESFTLVKAIGCILILVGILMVIMGGAKIA